MTRIITPYLLQDHLHPPSQVVLAASPRRLPETNLSFFKEFLCPKLLRLSRLVDPDSLKGLPGFS
jgi:hypothetical protein